MFLMRASVYWRYYEAVASVFACSWWFSMILGQKAPTLIIALACGWAAMGHAAEPPYRAEDLTRMSWADLECVYRQAEPGHTPSGFAEGRVVYCPDVFLAGAKSGLTHLLWRGKLFCPDEGTLVNQWRGLQAIHANVSPGPSWLDGKPAIILDYSSTSRVWSDVHDEMREVSPGVYLGAMYLRRCPEPRLKLFFVLKACACQ
jgi:hypothetical protein